MFLWSLLGQVLLLGVVAFVRLLDPMSSGASASWFQERPTAGQGPPQYQQWDPLWANKLKKKESYSATATAERERSENT